MLSILNTNSVADALLEKRKNILNEGVEKSEFQKSAEEEFQDELDSQELVEGINEAESDLDPVNTIINSNYQKYVGSKYFFVPSTEGEFNEYTFYVYALTNDGVGDEAQSVSDVTKVVKRVVKKFCSDAFKDFKGPDVKRVKTKEDNMLKFVVVYTENIPQ